MWRQRERGYRATLQSQSAPEDSADAAEIKTPPISLNKPSGLVNRRRWPRFEKTKRAAEFTARSRERSARLALS